MKGKFWAREIIETITTKWVGKKIIQAPRNLSPSSSDYLYLRSIASFRKKKSRQRFEEKERGTEEGWRIGEIASKDVSERVSCVTGVLNQSPSAGESGGRGGKDQ